MAIPLNLLIVEDSMIGAELLAAELESAGFEPKWKRVESEAGYRAGLEELPDLIISDFSLPQLDGLRAVDLLRERGLDIPLILVSGAAGEEKAVEAMKHGATDYLLKDRIGRLGNAVERALEQKRLRDERGRMQQQLALQAMALDSASNGIIITDSAGTILWVNPAFTTATGYTISEVVGKTPRVLKSGKQDKQFYHDFWQTITSGKTWRGEFINRRKDGGIYYDEHTVIPVRSLAGEITHFIGVINDVTARRRADEDLRAAHAQLRQLLDHCPAVIYALRLEGQNVVPHVVSENVTRLLGFSVSETLRYEWWAGQLHPQDRDKAIAGVSATLTHGTSRTEYRLRHKNGDYRWVDDNRRVVYGPSNQPAEIAGVWTDITERKKLEEDLRKSEAELRVTFENAAIGVALVDAEGHSLKSNRALQQLLGYSETELRCMAFTEFTHQDDVEADLALYREMLSGAREHYQIEKRYLRKGGEVVQARLTASMVRGPVGNAQYAVAMVEDITEKKKLEAQVLRAQRMESLGTLAGGIAHDLNNVLAPILISCELLQMEESDGDKRKLVGMIKGSAERGAELVKQVLSFASGIAGQRVAVQPKHLIREMANIARETFPKSIRINFKIASDLCMLLGDPTQLHQVLLNLCVNARDAMPTGGELTIAAENVLVGASSPRIDQDAKPGPHVVIKVTDTGTGIPTEIRKRIFDPFFTTKEVGKGTGLGLSTTLGIVKSHGGFIHVHSQPGKGSTFEIWLPGKKSEDLSVSLVEEVLLPRGHGELILVVDDEAFLRVMTSQTLEAYGYSVLTAANGADAVAIYSRNKDGIEVVLTDIMMPVMDGSALTLALRKINPTVRVIVASGLSDTEHHANAIGAGVKYFLPKPYHAERLLNSLYEILHEQKDSSPVPS